MENNNNNMENKSELRRSAPSMMQHLNHIAAGAPVRRDVTQPNVTPKIRLPPIGQQILEINRDFENDPTNNMTSSYMSPSADKNAPSSFEDVLNDIGRMGLWQAIIYMIIAYFQFWMSMYNLSVIFFQWTPEYHCNVPALAAKNWTVEQIKAISQTDECHIYNVDYEQLSQQPFEDLNATWPNQALIGNSTPLACEDFVFSTDGDMWYTMMSQFQLVCDRKLYSTHVQMIYMAGMLTGAMLAGGLSDLFGRKWVAICFMIASILVGMSHAYIPWWPLFMFSRFLLSFCSIPVWKSTFTMALEATSAGHRTWVGGLFWIPYSFGYATLALLAYWLRDWQHLHLVIGAPMIPAVFALLIYPESPRWLLSKGRVEEARKIILNAAKRNGRKLPADYNLDHVAHALQKERAATEIGKVPILALFKRHNGRFAYPTLILRALNLFFNWFVNAMVYYGISLNAGKFAGDLFLNNMASGLVEAPAYIVSVPLLYIGRKFSLLTTLLLAGITLFIIPFLAKSLETPILVLALTGKFAITASFGIVYVLTTELYPTVIRTSGLATSSCVARVGSMLAPYIADLDKIMPDKRTGEYVTLITFAVLSIIAGLLVIFLPETKGRRLPEHLDEAIKLQREDAKETDRVAPENGTNHQASRL